MADLSKEWAMLIQGVRDLKTSNVLAEAQDAVNQIKSAQTGEMEKRQAMEDVGRNLAAHLMAYGNPVAAVESMRANFAPKAINSADQAILQGVMTGDAGLTKAGLMSDRLSAENQMAVYEKKAGIDAQADARRFAQQGAMEDKRTERAFKLAAMRANSQKQTQGDVSFATNVKTALDNAKQLKSTIEKFGNSEVMNAKASAILDQASYDLAIAYAKIVDPETAAREGEVAAAQKYMIPLGMGTRNAKSLASIEEFTKKIQERAKARAEAKRVGSVDVYDLYFGGGAPDTVPGAAPSAPAAPAASEPRWKKYVR